MFDDPTPNPLTPGESELESALARLAPQVPPDQREAIAYEAGRRDERRAAMLWRICTGALAACLAVAVLPRSTPPAPAPLAATSLPPVSPPRVVALAPEEFRPAAGTYLAIRDEVLAKGLDALPAGTSGGGSADPRSVPRAIDVRRDASVQLPTLFGGRS